MVINVYPSVKNADPILIKAALCLLNQRLRIAWEIRRIKKQMGTKIYDPKREKEVLERLRLRLRSRNKVLFKEKDLEKIFATIIKVCHQSQR
jgi:chorismate mutase